MPTPADQPGAVPFGGAGYNTLPVVRSTYHNDATGETHPSMITAWEFSAAEVAEIVRSGRLWLTILGTQWPPVLLSTTDQSAPATKEIES